MMTNFILLQAQGDGGLSSIIMIVALIAIFYFFMIRPKSLLQERINQYYRHNKPRNLSKTIGVGRTDNQYPEGIGCQEGIVNPMIVFILEIPTEDEVIPYDNPHRTISQKVPSENHTHLYDFTNHIASC